MAEATFDFGFAGKRTVRVSNEEVSLSTSEFLRIRVRVLGPRPVVHLLVDESSDPLFTQDDMRFENSVLEAIFPPQPDFPFRRGVGYGLTVSFAGAAQYDVLIEKLGVPSGGGAVQVVQIIRDTTLASNDVRDSFVEMFDIL